MLPSILIWAAAAAAQAPAGVAELRDRYVEAVELSQRPPILEKLARTRPQAAADLAALFDLFTRFPNPGVHAAIKESVKLMGPSQRELEPAIIPYLESEEPEARILGVNLCLAIRCPRGLDLIENMAKKKFPARTPGELPELGERNAWWAVYEALSAAAQWKGEETFGLLEKQSDRAPAVAEIMASNFWERTLPKAAVWARGGSKDRERAQSAASASVSFDDLRPVRDPMLALLKDKKLPLEFRHRLAIKVGRCTDDDQAALLVPQIEAAADRDLRILLTTALFASNSRHAIPLLKRYAQEDPKPHARLGALYQLQQLLPGPEYRSQLEWTVKNDPDPENQEQARRQLKDLR